MDREKGEGEKRRERREEKKGKRRCMLRESVLVLETRGWRERRVECRDGVCNWLPRVVPCPTSRLCVSRTIAGGPSCFMPRTMILCAPTPSAYSPSAASARAVIPLRHSVTSQDNARRGLKRARGRLPPPRHPSASSRPIDDSTPLGSSLLHL